MRSVELLVCPLLAIALAISTEIFGVMRAVKSSAATRNIRKRNYVTRVYIQGGPKKVSHHQFFKKSHQRLPTRLDFFVKLKYESSTMIQSDGNKYSARDLLL